MHFRRTLFGENRVQSQIGLGVAISLQGSTKRAKDPKSHICFVPPVLHEKVIHVADWQKACKVFYMVFNAMGMPTTRAAMGRATRLSFLLAI